MVSDDRGQVLLVGAILIGVAILATVVVLNGIQYTANVGPDAAVRESTLAYETQRDVERDLRELVYRMTSNDTTVDQPRPYVGDVDPTAGGAYNPTADPNAAQLLAANVTAYNNYSLNMSVAGASVVTNATVLSAPGNTTTGTAFTQAESREFESLDNDADWQLVRNATAIPVARFNISDRTANNFTVRLNQTDGKRWYLNVSEDNVYVDASDGRPATPLCDSLSADVAYVRIVIEGDTGRIEVPPENESEVDCSTFRVGPDGRGSLGTGPDSNAPAGGPVDYNVSFVNGDAAEGEYTITVANGTGDVDYAPSEFNTGSPADAYPRVVRNVVVNQRFRFAYHGTKLDYETRFWLFEVAL